MLARRLATTAVFIPILLVTLLTRFPGQLVMAVVIAGCSVWGLSEFFNLAQRLGAQPARLWICFSAALLPLVVQVCHGLDIPYRYAFAWVVAAGFGVLSIHVYQARIEQTWMTLMASICGPLYVSIPLMLGQILYLSEPGAWILFFVILATWLSDTGAYFGGRMLGRHKLCPTISPGKTWEGSISGLLLSLTGILVVWGVQSFRGGPDGLGAGFFWTAGSWLDLIRLELLALMLVAGGTLGDLIESMLKRDLKVKDSGSGLTGHGGFLDITDSLLVNLPLMFFCVLLFEPIPLGI